LKSCLDYFKLRKQLQEYKIKNIVKFYIPLNQAQMIVMSLVEQVDGHLMAVNQLVKMNAIDSIKVINRAMFEGILNMYLISKNIVENGLERFIEFKNISQYLRMDALKNLYPELIGHIEKIY